MAAPHRIELELSARSPRALERAWCLARLTLELAGWRVRRKNLTRNRVRALYSAVRVPPSPVFGTSASLQRPRR